MIIIIWILAFMLLVIIHEFWHFIIAKKSWVKVLEFWIWIPPRIFKYYTDKSWTEYTFNLIPLWWFVRLKWEDPQDSQDFLAKDSFVTAKTYKKVLILLWWVLMNLIFAWLLFFVVFVKWVKPIQVLPDNILSIESQSYFMPSQSFLVREWFLSWDFLESQQKVVVNEILPWWLIEKYWIISWDVILKIDNTQVNSSNLSKVLKTYIWKSFVLEYQRWNEIKNVQIKCPDDNCLLWIILWNLEVNPIKFSIFWAAIASTHEIKAQFDLTISVLSKLVENIVSLDSEKIKQSVDKLSGPVWAVKVWWIIWDNFWIWHYLAFTWMISLALAIFNILPIPALDWWRLVATLIQSIFSLKPESFFVYEWYINVVMFVVLMLLWVYIIFLDLHRFWWVNIPFF